MASTDCHRNQGTPELIRVPYHTADRSVSQPCNALDSHQISLLFMSIWPIIIIIIHLCWQHAFPWFFRAIHPISAIAPGKFPRWADRYNFLLISQDWCVNLCLHLMFVLLGWFVRGDESGRSTAVLYWDASRICWKHHAWFPSRFVENTIVWFTSIFFSFRFVKVQRLQGVNPYYNINWATVFKNSCFILSERTDLHIVNNLSMHFPSKWWHHFLWIW